MKEDVNLPDAEHLSDIRKNIIEWFEDATKEVLVTVIATLD
jgi:hypothetical protein